MLALSTMLQYQMLGAIRAQLPDVQNSRFMVDTKHRISNISPHVLICCA
jgi:hypothetical protein